jgi:hypothetical protein
MRQMLTDYYTRLQRSFVLMGMSAKTLAPQVVDPAPHLDKQLEAICIHFGCPVRVFKGSERGELASSQDDEAWNDRKSARRNIYLTPKLIVPFVDRMIQLGIVEEPEEYHIKWPDLDALGDKDKAQIALTQTQSLSAYVMGNVEQIIQPHDFMTRILEWDDDTADEVLDEVERQQEEDQQEAQEQADEYGMVPTPPEGFQHAPQPPVIAGDAAGGAGGGPGGAAGAGAGGGGAKEGLPALGGKGLKPIGPQGSQSATPSAKGQAAAQTAKEKPPAANEELIANENADLYEEAMEELL